MEKLKRNYYNRSEFNNVMVMIAVSQMIEGIRGFGECTGEPMPESYYNKGIITKNQKKNLKMAHTYLKKFVDEAYYNADEKTKDKIKKKRLSFDFRLLDDYSLNKVYTLLNRMEDYKLNREELDLLVRAQFEHGCQDCVEDRNSCKIHDLFEDLFIPPNKSAGTMPNCEYSFLKEID